MTQQQAADARDADETAVSPDALREVLGEDYPAIARAARERGLSMEGWVRQTLLRAACEEPPSPKTPEDIRRALDKAMRHAFPSGDIEDILRETEAGRWAR